MTPDGHGVLGAACRAWPAHVYRPGEEPVAGRAVPFLGREDLVANKRAAGRTKDLADLEALGELHA